MVNFIERAIILTTNQPLSKWGEVFGDYTLAHAIIDRLVHHSQAIKITGQSYRVKGKKLFDDAETASKKPTISTEKFRHFFVDNYTCAKILYDNAKNHKPLRQNWNRENTQKHLYK